MLPKPQRPMRSCLGVVDINTFLRSQNTLIFILYHILSLFSIPDAKNTPLFVVFLFLKLFVKRIIFFEKCIDKHSLLWYNIMPHNVGMKQRLWPLPKN